MILIGDHQQLRPKVQNYKLNVDNMKTDHNFNVSLFERLVKAGTLPFGRLSSQHRMRPEISGLIKPFYPNLRDAEKTLGRASIRGLASDVVFIDHNHAEKDKTGFGSSSRRLGVSTERINDHEVGMICATTRSVHCWGRACVCHAISVVRERLCPCVYACMCCTQLVLEYSS